MLLNSLCKGLKHSLWAEPSRRISLLSTVFSRLRDISTLEDGPERDTVNFPRMVRPEFPAPVKHGFIPLEWFTFLYPKTGITGPYVLILGTTTYLASKEIYVIEHEFLTGISLGILSVYATKKLGPMMSKMADKEVDTYEQKWEESRLSIIKQYEEVIEEIRHIQRVAQAQKLLLDAKKKMVAVQLETEYRERQMEAYYAVKQRLDWEVEEARIARLLGQKHMVAWVERAVSDSVSKSPFEEKFMRKCIDELNSLGSQYQQSHGSGGHPGSAGGTALSVQPLMDWVLPLTLMRFLMQIGAPPMNYHIPLLTIRKRANRTLPLSTIFM